MLKNKQKLPINSIKALEKLIELSIDEFGENILAIYGMGSLGYGGYVEGWSDLDIDIILKNENVDGAVNIEQNLHNIGHTNIDVKSYTLQSVCQSSQVFDHGIVNRKIMLINNAVLIYGKSISDEIECPTSKQILEESIYISKWMYEKKDDWWLELPLDDTAAHMALPARLLFTVHKGEVTNKQTALKFILNKYNEEIDGDIWPWIMWSLSCRYLDSARSIPETSLKRAKLAAKDFMGWALKKMEDIQKEQTYANRTEKTY